MAALPPGPPLPAVVQAALVAREPYGWMLRRWRRYGDCFSSRFPGFGRVVYLAHPDAVRELFRGDPAVFHAGEANAGVLGPALGAYSLLTLDEDEHMGQRKLLLPPFHGQRVRRYGELIAAVTARELEEWPLGRSFRLHPHMQSITLEVILRAVFGVREEQRLRHLRRAIRRFSRASNTVIWLPVLRRDLGRLSPWRRFIAAREAVDALLYDEIARRRADPDAAERDDVLSLLLTARHEDGSPMSDQELRDELMTLLGAGHETTATGLAWTFERVLRAPAALERLLERLDDDAEVDAVVKETLRVRPVVTDVARKVTREVELGGCRIPAGTLVLAAIAVLHHRPDLYPEPEAFRPERFLEGQPDPYTWVPFGGGVRRCLGAAFAQFEMRVVLRAILRRARLRAPDARPERPRIRHVTAVPGAGARAVLDERVPSPSGAAALGAAA